MNDTPTQKAPHDNQAEQIDLASSLVQIATVELTAQDSRFFAEALVNSRPINPRLCETIRRYREVMGV